MPHRGSSLLTPAAVRARRLSAPNSTGSHEVVDRRESTVRSQTGLTNVESDAHAGGQLWTVNRQLLTLNSGQPKPTKPIGVKPRRIICLGRK